MPKLPVVAKSPKYDFVAIEASDDQPRERALYVGFVVNLNCNIFPQLFSCCYQACYNYKMKHLFTKIAFTY